MAFIKIFGSENHLAGFVNQKASGDGLGGKTGLHFPFGVGEKRESQFLRVSKFNYLIPRVFTPESQHGEFGVVFPFIPYSLLYKR